MRGAAEFAVAITALDNTAAGAAQAQTTLEARLTRMERSQDQRGRARQQAERGRERGQEDEAERRRKQRERHFDEMRKRTGEATRSLREMAEQLSAVATPLQGLTALATGAGFFLAAERFARNGAEIRRTAETLGVSGRALQGWRGAAELAGVSGSAVTSGLANVGRTLYEARAGMNPLAFAAAKQFNLNLMAPADKFMGELADRMKKLGPQEQRRLASIFGVEESLPLLRRGREAVEQLQEETRRHLYVTEEAQGRAEDLRHAYVGLTQSVEGTTTAIMAQTSRGLSPLLEGMSKWLDLNRDLVSTKVGGAINDELEALKHAADGWRMLDDLVQRYIDLRKIKENMPLPVIGALGGFLGGKDLGGIFRGMTGALPGVAAARGIWNWVTGSPKGGQPAPAAEAPIPPSMRTPAAEAPIPPAKPRPAKPRPKHASYGGPDEVIPPVGVRPPLSAAAYFGDSGQANVSVRAMEGLARWLESGGPPTIRIADDQLMQLILGQTLFTASGGGSTGGTRMPGRFGAMGPPRPPITSGGEALGRDTKIARPENAAAGMKYLMDNEGMTREQAAGVMGWLVSESGLNPRSHNDVGGGHTGIAQWDQNRWPRYLRETQGEPFDFLNQMRNQSREWHSSERGSYEAIKAARTVEEANAGMGLGERSGNRLQGMGYARSIFGGTYGNTVSAAARNSALFPPATTRWNSRGEPYSTELETMSDREKANVAAAMKTIGAANKAGKPWWRSSDTAAPAGDSPAATGPRSDYEPAGDSSHHVMVSFLQAPKGMRVDMGESQGSASLGVRVSNTMDRLPY